MCVTYLIRQEQLSVLHFLVLDTLHILCYYAYAEANGLIGHNNTLWNTIVHHLVPFVNPYFSFFARLWPRFFVAIFP